MLSAERQVEHEAEIRRAVQRARSNNGSRVTGPLSDVEQIEASFLRGNAIFNLPGPRPLVGDLLDLDNLAAIYGPSGSGKTHVALGIACAVATGRPWHGMEVAQGDVVYVICEGLSGIGERYRANLDHQGITDIPGLIWRPSRFNLLDTLEVGAVTAALTKIRPKLVIFDTLARSMPGGEENGKDMGIVVEHLDGIRIATGCTPLVVHHSGGDLSRGLRGHTALHGAMDSVIQCTGGNGTVTLKVEKLKNREDGQVYRFRLVREGASVVLVRGGEDDHQLAPSVMEVLRTLGDIDTGEGVATTVWQTTCESVSKASFYRHRGQLSTLGLSLNVGTAKQPRWSLSKLGEMTVGLTVSEESHDVS